MSDDELRCDVVQPLRGVLADAGPNAGEIWLWCIWCGRFFQAKHVRRDYLGNMEGCAFCKCAGFDIALHHWDTFADDDSAWPASTAELQHGLKRPPLDPALCEFVGFTAVCSVLERVEDRLGQEESGTGSKRSD